MATAAISGKDGIVADGGGAGDVGSEVKEWEATIEVELLDATSFDSAGFREFIEGLKQCTGTFTAIGTPPIEGALTALVLQTGQATGDLTITGDAILNSVGVGTPVDGMVEYSAAFSYTGAFTVGAVP